MSAGKALHAGVERRYMVGATLVCAAAISSVSAFGSLPALAVGLVVVVLGEGTVNVALLSLPQRRTEPG